MKKKAIFLCNSPAQIDRVYGKEALDRIDTLVRLDRSCVTSDALRAAGGVYADVEYVFSTWGMPSLSEEEIRRELPALRAVFYAAGSVQAFARPFLACGVEVFSAWAANAVPVAEYTVAQILLANKGFYRTCAVRSQGVIGEAFKLREAYPGNYGARVGLIGVGMIGSMVAEMLKAYRLEVAVTDPFLSEERAEALGVIRCSLEELFATSQVVSNHLANNEQTRGMLRYNHFASMCPHATFLNTGRGAQVREDDLVRALRERPDLTAVLDVTDPEPPVEGHPFYSLENCFLTPHIAGSSGDEVCRMAEYMAEEAECFLSGRETRYGVTLKMLETMA